AEFAAIAAIARLAIAFGVITGPGWAVAGVIAAGHIAVLDAALAILLAVDPLTVVAVEAAGGVVLAGKPRGLAAFALTHGRAHAAVVPVLPAARRRAGAVAAA